MAVKRPEIEFPCDYPIKVIGKEHPSFREKTLEVIARYDASVDYNRVVERTSNQGNYIAVTVWITATGEPQLQGIFEDLKATGLVSMVL
jgi:putative lipoic acid-binding regulatory protein